MPKHHAKTPLPVAAWIISCAFCQCAGWGLSAIHQLNLVGYVAAFLAAGAAGYLVWKRAGIGCACPCHKLMRRYRRPFAFAFLVLATMAFIGGAIHAPNNFDGLSYRTPRVLNWLAEGQWHWIHTGFQRLNVRAVGWEWVTVPFLVFTKTDRFFFLINVVSFLLLPGLIFSMFRRLGVKSRAAWHWMWLLPSGYCFILQAGSIGNDLFGAVFALAAMDLALRARASGSAAQVWLSCLAVALLTASKTSNLPLLLPWLVAIYPALPSLNRRVVATIGVAAASVVASFLPMAVENYRHCGDWTGQAAEQSQFGKGNPVLVAANNGVLLVTQNFTPPVFPLAKRFNASIQKRMPTKLRSDLEACFEIGGAHWTFDEMQAEEGAGLGFGVSVLLLVSLFGRMKRFAPVDDVAKPGMSVFAARLIRLSALVSLLGYMVKAAMTAAARLITPYYAVLIPSVLAGGSQARVVRSAWWRWMAIAMQLLAAGLLVISPSRPLWPAKHVLTSLDKGGNATLTRAITVYSLYGERANAFAPILEKLPGDASVLGFISFDNPETSLWRPFGSRRVVHVTPEDTGEVLRQKGVKYVLVSSGEFGWMFNTTLDEWMTKVNGELAWIMPLSLRASRGPVDWFLVKLKPDGDKKA
jgi:hypothetical protein